MSAIDEVVARATAGLASLEQTLGELSALRGRATDPSGLVTVEVDEQGGLIDLRIPESLRDVDARELGRAVVATAARAAATVAERRDRILASLHDRLND
ncbi:hypothetical protein GCM10023094_22260 [Rhodococcus olei]|uniref:YbaB/EbfC DNA-binding family protein n=1 Tax=Rhodococcus olei TaxID=2161675 RepID=A0ABP8P2P6_9NOCA